MQYQQRILLRTQPFAFVNSIEGDNAIARCRICTSSAAEYIFGERYTPDMFCKGKNKCETQVVVMKMMLYI